MKTTERMTILERDSRWIVERVGAPFDRLRGRTVLVTGGAGFLGSWFLHALAAANENRLAAAPCRIVCVDNFIRGVPRWLAEFSQRQPIDVIRHGVVELASAGLPAFSFAIHAASIASPTYYRKYPIETMDANVLGLRALLDVAVARRGEVESLLFMSSSEIYGDPMPGFIPTPEDYRGYVSCTGPRACYDESKRYGETLCVNFHRAQGVPVKIVRPFNNYGPGLPIDDARLVPDLARNVLAGHDIELFSDGSPSRTFCYAADAVAGYFQLLLSLHDGEAFNIGSDGPEVTVREVADLVAAIARREFGIDVRVLPKQHQDREYLSDNPQRRCPDISKAKRLLGFEPAIGLGEGLRRSLLWYQAEAQA